MEAVHQHLTAAFEHDEDPISPPGIRDRGLLESAVARQHVGYGEETKYPTAILNAASLMYGLCNDHPFHNGNKRAALIAGIMHLDRNNIVLTDVTVEELYALMVRIARQEMSKRGGGSSRSARSSDAEVRGIADWLSARARKIQRGERTVTYKKLLEIVSKFKDVKVEDKGFDVHFYIKRRSKITGKLGWKRKYTLRKPGDHKDVGIHKVKDLRKALNLTEKDGVDSIDFYDEQTSIDKFIIQHRRVLRRLAKT